MLAARRRPGALASRRLRLASVGVLSTVGPTLLLGCPPQGKPFGTFGEAALFFVTDAIGSTILAIRPNGTVRNRYLYRPFGGMAVEEGHDLEHGFAGGARLAGTALYALGPRLYHADTGHFYEPDPWLGDPAQPRTLQSYGYALGNPLSYSDPSGMQPVCDFPGGCGPSLPPPIIFDPFRPIPYPPAPRWQHPPENRATNVPAAPPIQVPQTVPCGEDACVVVPERSVEGPAPQEAGVGAAIARMLGYLARTRFIATRFPWLAGPGGAAAVKFATDPSRAALIQRLVASDGSLRVSKTVAQQLTTSRIYIPNQSILDVVGSGVRLPDPQGVAGQFMYRAQASFNGSLGQLEVLVNEHLGVINHVLYKSIK